MTIKRLRPPLEGSAYNGFAAAPGGEPGEAEAAGAAPQRERPPVPNYPIDRFRERRRRHDWLRTVVLALTVAAAMGLAVLLVLWSRETRPAAGARTAVASAAAPAPEPVAAAPPPPVRADQALTAAPQIPAARPAIRQTSAPARGVAAEVASATTPRTRCDRRRQAIDRLICRDRGLASLDRDLNAAFADAVRSGAPSGPLSEDQEAWVIRRDRAAEESPESVADLYRARIAQLNEAAQRR